MTEADDRLAKYKSAMRGPLLCDPPEKVIPTLIDLLWDSSSLMIPTDDHVRFWIEVLRSRDDAHLFEDFIKDECMDFLSI